METRKAFGLIFLQLCVPFAIAQTIELGTYFELIKKNHPYFAKEEMSVVIEKTSRDRYLGAEDWIITASPHFVHQKPVGSSAFSADRVDLLNLSAGLERAFWTTGGRFSIVCSSELVNQTVPAISIAGFSIPLGFDHYYQNRIYAMYSQPLLQNFMGKLDRLNFELSGYSVDLKSLQVAENQELFLLEIGGQFLDWVLLGEQEKIATERLHLAEEELNQVRRKREANLVEQVDVLRSEDAVRISRQNIMLIKSRWKSKQAELAVLATSTELYEQTPYYDLYELADLPSLEDAVIRLRSRSRLLQALDTAKKQMEHRRYGLVDISRPQLFVNVGAGLQNGEEQLSDALVLDRPDLFVGINFRYPLGNRRARTDIEVIDLELRRVELEVSQVALDLEASLSSLMIQIDELREVMILNLEQIASAQQKTAEELKLYNQGRGDLTFVIQSRDNEQNAKLLYAQNGATYQHLILQYRALMDELNLTPDLGQD